MHAYRLSESANYCYSTLDVRGAHKIIVQYNYTVVLQFADGKLLLLIVLRVHRVRFE